MSKNKAREVDVFCAASKSQIDEVLNWTIPSLQRQKNIDKVNLCVINYLGESNLFNDKKTFGKVKINEISKGKRCGFGECHNFAFGEVNPKNYFVVTNPGYLHEDCLSKLIDKKESEPKAGIIEARQLPYSHPRKVDPETGETAWASGACCLIDASFFEDSGGYDENYWMYKEDVDLSIRAKIRGWKVFCEVNSVIYHYTGVYFGYREDRYYFEHLWSARNALYFFRKYWGKPGELYARWKLQGSNYPRYFKREVLKFFKESWKTRKKTKFKRNLSKVYRARSSFRNVSV